MVQKYARVQEWQDGQIVKTPRREYKFIKSSYESKSYPTIAELVKHESNKTTERSAAIDTGATGKPEDNEPATALDSEGEESHDIS